MGMHFLTLLLLTLFTASFQINALSQKDYQVLDSLYEEIEFLTGDSWYLEKTKQGFQVTFCRSCAEKYSSYLDTTDFFSRKLKRSDFFQANQIDSVSYYSTVSGMTNVKSWSEEQKMDYFTSLFKADDVLRFEVIIDDKWSDVKYNATLERNNQLKEAILKEPIYKTSMEIFSDYRFWLPAERWRTRTQEFDFYFERLPYASSIVDKSILIEHNKPFFFCEPMLVDKNDQEYFYKNKNRLENERQRTLNIIALALGIHDFRIVN